MSIAALPQSIGARGVPVRFRMLGVLLTLGFVNYLLRNNISVALPSIRAEFDFTSTQLGWILSSFSVAYALFQIPGGLFGVALGPRRALALIAFAWGVLTLLTGFVPAVLVGSATAAMIGLMVVRFLMGATQAPIFPVSAGAFARWFPVGHWAFPNAMQSVGLALGQASVGPLVTVLIVAFGWRASFYWLAPLAFVVAAWWWWYARDTPREHAAVTPGEVALIEAGREAEVEPAATARTSGLAGIRRVLLDRHLLVLSLSYFCMNCVFYMFADWLFTYLVEERGFGLIAGGFLFALPFITGAVFAALGGITCDRLCQRIGARWGCRAVAVTPLLLVSVLLLAGAHAVNPYTAVALLALCFGFTQVSDAAYWSAATFLGRRETSATTSVMNTGGSLPGFLAPAIGFMIDHAGWLPTFAIGSVMAVIAAMLWLLVDVSRVPRRSEPVPVG